MEFSNFAPLIEVFTGLNLLYATNFKPIKQVLRNLVCFNKVSDVFSQYNDKVYGKDIKQTLVWSSSNHDNNIRRAKVRLLRRLTFIKPERIIKEWEEMFKAGFLSAGIFSVLLLVMIGLEKTINYQLIILIFSIIFIFHLLLSFAKSFDATKASRLKFKLENIVVDYSRLLLIITITILFSLICSDSLINDIFWHKKWNYSILKFLFFAPLFAYAAMCFRVVIHIFREKSRLKSLFRAYKDAIEARHLYIRESKLNAFKRSQDIRDRLKKKRSEYRG